MIWSAEFSADGRRIVSASKDTTIRIWDAETSKELALLRGHDSDAFHATFAPDGQTILTTGKNDGTAWLWNVAAARERLVLRGHSGVGSTGVGSATFSPDSRLLVTASFDKTARLWDVSTGQQIFVFGHEDEVTFAFFSSDGKTVTTWSRDGTAGKWDVATGRVIERFSAYDGVVKSFLMRMGLSANLSRLADISQDGTVRLWDVAERESISSFPAETENSVVGISFDGRILATFGLDSLGERVALWDTTGGTQVGLLRGHSGGLISAAFSPDGRSVATAGLDSTIRLWDVATSRERMLLRGHDGPVFEIALSPDGRTVVTGSSDKTARLWDAETGQPLEVLSGHEDMVLSVRFSPDGRSVVTASSDRTVRIWPVLPRGQALIDLACARVPWPLSESQQQRFGISEEWCTPEASATLRAKLDMDAPASTH